MDNYSPELERAQLLEEFKLAHTKYETATEAKNDARLERAKWLLKILETFPIVERIGRGNRTAPFRPEFKIWCENNISIGYRRVLCELTYARDPSRLIHSRQKHNNNPNKAFSRAYGALTHWPEFTDEQRQRLIDRVVEYAHAS